MTVSLLLKRRVWARLMRYAQKRKPVASVSCPAPSSTRINLFTPLLPKDLEAFRVNVEYARRHIKHPLGTHFVAGPDREEIREACRDTDCEFVDEQELAGFPITAMQEWSGKVRFRRRGWIYQQILKLNADALSPADPVLILDADTIFVSPVVFEHDGRFILSYTDGYIAQYDDLNSRLLGTRRFSGFSFIAHHMLMAPFVLEQLKESLEQRFSTKWDDAILRNLDYDSFLPLSEYELYGNYAMLNHRPRHKLRYWFNRAISLHADDDMRSILDSLSGQLICASFHSHQKKGRPVAARKPAP